MKAAPPLVVLLAAVAAPAPALAKVQPMPAATPSGPPVSCLRITDIRETRVRSDRVIDFYMRANGKFYRNTLPYSCSGLNTERAFSYQVTNGRLCSVDIIRVFDQALRMPGAACGLGEFQPVTGLGR